MAVPQLIAHCPKHPACASKRLYKDGERILQLTRAGQFEDHVCKLGQASRRPDMGWSAEWRNRLTGRIRWIGPDRLMRSVLRPPADNREQANRYRKDKTPTWELINVYRSPLNWEKVDPEVWETLSKTI